MPTLRFARYLTFYVLLFMFVFTLLLYTLLTFRYAQLSKYAMTVAHKVSAAREPIA